MFTKSFLIGAASCALGVSSVAQNATSVGTWSAANVFMDAGLNPLDAGGDAVGDGDLIQLGYFDGVGLGVDVTNPAEFGAAEWGSFVPISGAGSLNPHLISDMGAPGFGGPIGIFTFNVRFTEGVDFIPDSSLYRLGLRVYDANTMEEATHYNTVTSNDSNWRLPTPGFPEPTPPLLDLDGQSLTFQGTAFVTDMPMVIPEPSSTLLILLGAASLAARRRR